MLLGSKQLRDHLEQAQDLDSRSDGELKCHLIAELVIVLGIGEQRVFNFDDALRQIALKVAAIRAEERRHAPELTSTRRPSPAVTQTPVFTPPPPRPDVQPRV